MLRVRGHIGRSERGVLHHRHAEVDHHLHLIRPVFAVHYRRRGRLGQVLPGQRHLHLDHLVVVIRGCVGVPHGRLAQRLEQSRRGVAVIMAGEDCSLLVSNTVMFVVPALKGQIHSSDEAQVAIDHDGLLVVRPQHRRGASDELVGVADAADVRTETLQVRLGPKGVVALAHVVDFLVQ